METKFPKLADGEFPTRWARFFHAGTEWIQAFELLKEEKNKHVGNWLPYVYSYALGIASELFVKSIAAHEDRSFNPIKFGHRTTDIIKAYANSIPIFDNIQKNAKLIGLMKTYEDTMDTKFGDTTISIDGDDEQMVSDAVYELRAETTKRTGVR